MTKEQKKIALQTIKDNRFIVKGYFKPRRVPIIELKFKGLKNIEISRLTGESPAMIGYVIKQAIGDIK